MGTPVAVFLDCCPVFLPLTQEAQHHCCRSEHLEPLPLLSERPSEDLKLLKEKKKPWVSFEKGCKMNKPLSLINIIQPAFSASSHLPQRNDEIVIGRGKRCEKTETTKRPCCKLNHWPLSPSKAKILKLFFLF